MPPEGFNPRRDLFLFATQQMRNGEQVFAGFQSQAGFVPLCDALPFIEVESALIVSIPGGICSSLRRLARPLHRACHARFNPRRDLFLFATMRPTSAPSVTVTFQSQAGFVPLCDVPPAAVGIIESGVSIPGGICSSLRQIPTRRKTSMLSMFQSQAGFVPLCDEIIGYLLIGNHHVSIPGGICSSLRLILSCLPRPLYRCFNPRRDLFLFATYLRFHLWTSQDRFQSQAGFVPLCDAALPKRQKNL